MNYENTAASTDHAALSGGQASDTAHDVSASRSLVPVDNAEHAEAKDETKSKDATGDNSKPKAATVLVRGEMVNDQQKDAQSKNPSAKDAKSKEKEKSPPKAVSESKVKLQNRLPALDDDADVGVEKAQVVTRDGKADLAFNGTLLAAAAPSIASKGSWQEYRVYHTSGGKHVFSKVTRTIYAEDQDKYDAEVFDDSPSSMPSQLLRSARDLTRSRPLEWTDAAAAYFGYDPLAKALYRKLSGQFEEHIT